MGRIVACADAHLGNFRRFGGSIELGMNRRCALSLDVLWTAATRATNVQADTFVICGDLIDSSRPPPQLIRAVQEVFEALRADEIQIVLLVGNHERESDAPLDHALGPFTPLATVVDRPCRIRTAGGWLACLPHRKARGAGWFEEALREALDGAGSAPVVVAMHAGIVDASTPSFLRSAGTVTADEVLDACARYNVRRVFAGDHHNHRRWGSRGEVTQLGALVPTGFANPGLDGYGTIAIYDDRIDTVVLEHLPGPRFVCAPFDAYALDRAVVRGDKVFALLADDTAARDAIDLLKEEGLIVDGAIESGSDISDVSEARDAAKDALAVEDDAGAALAAFVEKMALPAGVSAERVLARANDHLAAARARASA